MPEFTAPQPGVVCQQTSAEIFAAPPNSCGSEKHIYRPDILSGESESRSVSVASGIVCG